MARPSNGNGLAIADLQRMLSQKKSDLKRLYKKRAQLERELTGVDREIASIEGGGKGGRRGGGVSGRARNESSLIDTLDSVLRSKGEPMGVGDILKAVEATGYRSSSDNFRGIINQTLIKDRKRFQKAGRGLYFVKPEGKAKKGE